MIVTLTLIDGTKWRFPRPAGQDGTSVIYDLKPGWVLIQCNNGTEFALHAEAVTYIEAVPNDFATKEEEVHSELRTNPR